jgi:hypothetical protein
MTTSTISTITAVGAPTKSTAWAASSTTKDASYDSGIAAIDACMSGWNCTDDTSWKNK